MFLTKEQAKETWCPYAHVVSLPAPVISGYNRAWIRGGKAENNHPACTGCLADKCACWRWEASLTDIDLTTSSVEKRGYCGLAGRPC